MLQLVGINGVDTPFYTDNKFVYLQKFQKNEKVEILKSKRNKKNQIEVENQEKDKQNI